MPVFTFPHGMTLTDMEKALGAVYGTQEGRIWFLGGCFSSSGTQRQERPRRRETFRYLRSSENYSFEGCREAISFAFHFI